MLANRLVGLSRGVSYYDEVTADSPVAWWRLDETSGTTANDSVGTNHGTYAGATLNQAPLINAGSAVLFSGSGSGITIPDAASLSFASSLSLECWIKTTTAAARSSLIEKGEAGSQWAEYWLYLNSSGTVTCQVRSGNSDTPNATATTAVTINDGAAHHIVAVFVPSSTLKIYIDGVERASASHSIAASFNSAAQLYLGRRNSAFPEPLAGTMDEIALYGAALSAARVTAHYNAGTA